MYMLPLKEKEKISLEDWLAFLTPNIIFFTKTNVEDEKYILMKIREKLRDLKEVV